jgi:hypothetical protein
MSPNRFRERLVALIVLALLLFSPPLLLVADRAPDAGGLSRLPLYLFLAWTAVIALAAWLMEGKHTE